MSYKSTSEKSAIMYQSRSDQWATNIHLKADVLQTEKLAAAHR